MKNLPKRKIIKIDANKCNGCGLCIPDCPEGALQMIEGKARLVSDLFCDGLGACMGTCPQGAIEVEERESEPYDEFQVMENIVKAGENTIKAHLKHLKDHNQDEFYNQAIEYLNKNNLSAPTRDAKKTLGCGCPGNMQKDLSKERKQEKPAPRAMKMSFELGNWPIQLKLLNPDAPYLKNADLLIAADCTAFAYPDFHQRFLKNKVLVMLCPKLDSDISSYVDKLADILSRQNIQSVSLVRMEVPCCGGVESIVKQAMITSGKNIIIKDYTVSLNGGIV